MICLWTQIMDHFSEFPLFFQVERVRSKRFFVSCFEVTPDFAVMFEYQKAGNPIKYLEAGFNRDQQSGEFFIEFEEQIHDTELELSFQAQHAKGINVLTFPNDNGKSASDALLRVMAVQNKTGFKLSRGKFPDSLKKSFEIQKAAQDKTLLDREFNEKTHAAEKISFEEVKSKMDEVCSEVQGLGHFQQGIKDDVHGLGQFQQGIKDDVQSYGVKMEAGFEGVKQEVLSFIPDFQERVKQLEKEVDYHKAQRDAQEYKTARQTAKVNQRDREIAVLQNKEEASIKREDGLRGRIKELENIVLISSTVEKLKEMTRMAQEDRAFASTELKEMTRMAQEDRAFTRAEREELRYSITDIQESAKTLEGLLSTEEERAFKRPRA